jgi:hypothetical protein
MHVAMKYFHVYRQLIALGANRVTAGQNKKIYNNIKTATASRLYYINRLLPITIDNLKKKEDDFSCSTRTPSSHARYVGIHI